MACLVASPPTQDCLLCTGPRDIVAMHKSGSTFPAKVEINQTAGGEGYTGTFQPVSCILETKAGAQALRTFVLYFSHTRWQMQHSCDIPHTTTPCWLRPDDALQVEEDYRVGLVWCAGDGQVPRSQSPAWLFIHSPPGCWLTQKWLTAECLSADLQCKQVVHRSAGLQPI